MKYLLPVISLLAMAAAAAAELSDAELARIGHKVWMNECAGTVAGLTSWNEGEDFASLGIGHFIWYPAGKRGPFEESFPPLMEYLAAHGQPVAGWIRGACPWNSRAEFMAAQHGDKLGALRKLLAETVPLQARFLARRMHDSLPKMLAAASPADAEKIRRNFALMEACGAGTFALVDYVNFKGEGTLATERYNGQGWGLLQVLETMPEGVDIEHLPSLAAGPRPDVTQYEGGAVGQFSIAASRVLRNRVHNAPPERHEERWLTGWEARVKGYMQIGGV